MKPTPTLDKIEQLVNETPGLTGSEISELLEGKHIANELLRLVQKGRLVRTPKGKSYIYSPAVHDCAHIADMIMVEPSDEPADPAEAAEKPAAAVPSVEGIKRIEVNGRSLVRAKQPAEYCNRDLLALYKDIVNELKARNYFVKNPGIRFERDIDFSKI